MTQQQLLLTKLANQMLKDAGCRWDGRKYLTDPKKIEEVKAQVGFERAQVMCPFSGRSKRK